MRLHKAYYVAYYALDSTISLRTNFFSIIAANLCYTLFALSTEHGF